MEETTPTNPRLEFFRSQIGQDMSKSPSPLGRWLKGRIQAVDLKELVVEYTIHEEMTNPMGVLHGGAAAAILDDIAGSLVFALGRDYGYTSVNLTLDFLHSARLGETITATATIIRAGKNIIHVEGIIRSAGGKIIAKCATNLIQTSVKLPF
ncbi:hypothetical protein GCM10023189_05320 [Nibrella saemangeumensis]|uniref:Thioesterase domain-containing protein n=1 Tax=Nibrella saemangeumensis TaxID=1084526 RepID=A0ABP8MF06_9BACT